MPRKKTREEFIQNAKKVHGDKYDYSRVIYTNNRTNVEIICRKHGSFFQSPSNHLSQANGCPKCKADSQRRLIFGVGINDVDEKCMHTHAYSVWFNILRRCYDENSRNKFLGYIW